MSGNPAAWESCFSDSYWEARDKFYDCLDNLPPQVVEHKRFMIKGLRGPFGEELSQDYAIIKKPMRGGKGTSMPKKMLLHTSGTHGVEGFAGSAIQVYLLRNYESEIEPYLDEDTVVIFIHAVNAYGMAWYRRWTSNNVDINRNCIFIPGTTESDESFFAQLSSHPPEDYLKMAPLMNPRGRRGICDCYLLKSLFMILWYGYGRVKQAAAGGQYFDHNLIYFGGYTVEEEPKQVLNSLMEAGIATVERFIHVDVHTGLGPWGKDTLLCESGGSTLRKITGCEEEVKEIRDPTKRKVQDDSGEDDEDVSIAYTTFGSFCKATKTLAENKFTSNKVSDDAKGSRSKTPSSRRRSASRSRSPKSGKSTSSQCEALGFVQEFGTYPGVEVFGALRAEHAALRENKKLPLDSNERKEVRRVFYPPSEAWRRQVMENGVLVFHQCLENISC